MYKDIISYKLAENISEEHLLSVCKDIVKNWMSKQSGFVRWEIHKNNNGVGYTDIVYWESKNDAKKAETNMVNAPNANSWYSCYEKDSISSQNLDLLVVFD